MVEVVFEAAAAVERMGEADVAVMTKKREAQSRRMFAVCLPAVEMAEEMAEEVVAAA